MSLLVSFTTPSKLSVMDGLVGTITLHIFCTLNSACTHWITPLPTIFTLWDPEVHICTSNSGDVSTNIEAPIDKALGLHSALYIPNVYSYDRHVWFWWNLDHSGFRGQNNIIEDMISLDSTFNLVWCDTGISILKDIENTNDLEE